MESFKYKGNLLDDILQDGLSHPADAILANVEGSSETVTGFYGINSSGQFDFMIIKNVDSDHPYITPGDMGYKQQGTPISAMSKYNEHKGSTGDTTQQTVNVQGFNKIAGTLVAGTYGGAGGGGGTNKARGGPGGHGGQSEVISFHNVDISSYNQINIEIGCRGNSGPRGNGNEEGDAGDGGVSNFQYGDGKSRLYKNATLSTANLLFTANTGSKGTGGDGAGQSQGRSSHPRATEGQSVAASTYPTSLPGGSIPITVNRGKGGNGGDGGQYGGGQGQEGQVGQVGYGLIFLQKG